MLVIYNQENIFWHLQPLESCDFCQCTEWMPTLLKSFMLTGTFPKSCQPIVVFHIETSHLFCRVKQVTGFYMICNTGLKWVNKAVTRVLMYNMLVTP